MRTKADVRETPALLLELVGRMHQRFAAVAFELGLTPPQMGVLKNLEEPRPMGHLASELHCDASNVTWMTDRLEERGLVERTADPLDRRVKRLVLTEKGRKLRSEIERRLRAGVPGLDRLSADERRTLGRLLERMLHV
jgi:DNA-binding MarR family transcriptional regulator